MKQRSYASQIDKLAQVLIEEFGGLTRDESACEAAIRILAEQKALILDYGMEIAKLKEDRREAREWARKLWCRILVEKEQNAAAIVWAYRAARGATREACALLCDQWAAFYRDRSDNMVHYTCRYLAAAIRGGDDVILSTGKKG